MLSETPTSADSDLRSANQEISIHGRALIAIGQDSSSVDLHDRARTQRDPHVRKFRDPDIEPVLEKVRSRCKQSSTTGTAHRRETMAALAKTERSLKPG